MKDYWVRASFGEGYGGVMTFISKAAVPDESSITDTPLVVGRALRVQISGGDCKQVIHNIHNFGLQGQVMADLCRSVDVDSRESKADPLHFCLFVLGDMNITPSDGKIFEYGTPEATLETSASLIRPPAGPLQQQLLLLTEFESSTPTRYQSDTNSAVVIDRVFGNLPPSFLTKCRVAHSVEQDPRDLYKSGISDHAPVLVSIFFKAPLPAGEGAIPAEVFKHKMYSYYLDKLCWDEKYDEIVFQDSFFRNFDTSRR